MTFNIVIYEKDKYINLATPNGVINVNTPKLYCDLKGTLSFIKNLGDLELSTLLLKTININPEFNSYLDYIYRSCHGKQCSYEDSNIILRDKIKFVEDIRDNIFFM